jgi:hypothetical protein
MTRIKEKFLRLGNILQVLVMSTALSIILYTGGNLLLAPNPYTNVVIEYVRPESVHGGDGWVVSASFKKKSCQFVRLEVVGLTLGVPEILEWDPISKGDKDYDRNNGNQQLKIFVKPFVGGYDTIEIRTRHNCNGETVDKVFATIPLNNL